jgi:large subunit ribosomal protein L15
MDITPELLMENGFVGKNELVKILGNGELQAKLTVKAHAFSQSAEAAITNAGGTIEKI